MLVFRDQQLTPQQHIDYSRRFGELQIHVLRQFLLTGHPEVFIIANIIENGQPVGLADAGKFWYSNLSYKKIPSLGSMLYARELPSEGGDTLFASQQAAYDALPAELKTTQQGKLAAHSYLARYDDEVFTGIRRPTLTTEQIAKVDREFIKRIVLDPEITFTITPQRTFVYAQKMHELGILKHQAGNWQEYFFPEVHGRPGS